jgi:hypothetical protein
MWALHAVKAEREAIDEERPCSAGDSSITAIIQPMSAIG